MAWSIFREGGGDSYAVGWAQQFLTLLGAPVTPGNTTFVYQWEKAEGGGGKYNPLNTGGVYGHPELTTTGTQYGGGANDFASWQAGLTGSTINVSTPGPDNYPAIVSALKANDPAAAQQALFNSGWAASHYGYGSAWPNTGLPGASPVDFNTAPLNSATTPGVTTSKSSTCMIGIPSPNLNKALNPYNMWPFNQILPNGGSATCILPKTGGRAAVGAFLLLAGAVALMVGALSLAKASGSSGAVRVLSEAPVLGRAVRKAS